MAEVVGDLNSVHVCNSRSKGSTTKAAVTRSEGAENVYCCLEHVQKVGKSTLNYIINVATEEQMLHCWNVNVTWSLDIMNGE